MLKKKLIVGPYELMQSITQPFQLWPMENPSSFVNSVPDVRIKKGNVAFLIFQPDLCPNLVSMCQCKNFHYLDAKRQTSKGSKPRLDFKPPILKVLIFHGVDMR